MDRERKHEISADALDRLLEAIGSIVVSVDELGKKVEDAARDGSITAQAMRETRKDLAALVQRADALADRMVKVEARTTSTERSIRRHDAGFRTHSDTDAKHESELAALMIAVDETRKLAKQTAIGLENLKRDQAKSTTEQTSAIVKKVQDVEEDTRKARLPASAAAAINLAVGLVYLLLKLLESRGH